MQAAPEHPNEEKRIESLKRLEILDTLPETEFQEIVEIASRVCDAPISLISLVDSNRQWFKASVGLNAKETPRDLAFCAHAILQDDVFEVPQALNDPRFFDNPLVTSPPHVLFYAGAPLQSPDQLPIGTLCVIDDKPRSLTADQKEILKKLSSQVTKLLDLRLQNKLILGLNQELRYAKIALENMSEGVVLQQSSGEIVAFNSASLKILGLSHDELLGRTSTDPNWKCIHEDGSAFVGEQHPAMVTLKTGLPQKDVIMGVHNKQNEVRWISINSTPIHLPQVKENKSSEVQAVTTFADVTHKRHTEKVLIESAKLNSLGTMAGGIAHEINTPLASIMSTAELLLEDFSSDSVDIRNASKKVEKILKTSVRISEIVKALKFLSRDATHDPVESVSLRALLDDVASICSEKMTNRSVKLVYSYPPNVTIPCVGGQVLQVLVNLVSNSLDAIDKLNHKWIELKTRPYEEGWEIIVRDSGVGISQEVQSKLMTPFFTTKPVGQGTGLGLSLSKKMIEKMGGSLYYELNDGHTAFVVRLRTNNTNPQNPGG